MKATGYALFCGTALLVGGCGDQPTEAERHRNHVRCAEFAAGVAVERGEAAYARCMEGGPGRFKAAEDDARPNEGSTTPGATEGPRQPATAARHPIRPMDGRGPRRRQYRDKIDIRMRATGIWTLGALLAALLLTGLIGVDTYLAWNAIRETRVERETATMRTWEPTVITVRADRLRIPGGRGPVLIATTQTRCSGSHLYYSLTVRKNPRCCTDSNGQGAGAPLATVLLDLASLDDLLSSIRRFNLRLIDQGAATMKTVVIPRRRVFLQSDNAGGIRAGEASADVPWDCGAYRQVKRVVVESEEFREQSERGAGGLSLAARPCESVDAARPRGMVGRYFLPGHASI